LRESREKAERETGGWAGWDGMGWDGMRTASLDSRISAKIHLHSVSLCQAGVVCERGGVDRQELALTSDRQGDGEAVAIAVVAVAARIAD
jgi:hypothetical protein